MHETSLPTTPPATAPRFIDSHVHFDADQFADDLDQVIGDAVSAGVERFINIGYEPARWLSTAALAARYRCVLPVFGMHPGSCDQWNSSSANHLARLIEGNRPVAIGEIGIDLFRGETNLVAQQEAFAAQLDLAEDHRLPVVIHMRAAESEVLDLLCNRSSLPPLLFHSFEGTAALTDFVNQTGSYVGVGGLATRSKSVTIRQELSRIDLSRVVLETDAPYLVPAKRRGTRNVPANLPAIADMLANLKLADIPTIADITTTNAIRFFGLQRGCST